MSVLRYASIPLRPALFLSHLLVVFLLAFYALVFVGYFSSNCCGQDPFTLLIIRLAWVSVDSH